MKAQIRFLLQLHELDSKLHGCQEVLEKIPKELAEIEKELFEARTALEELTKRSDEMEKEKRTKEREVETSEARLKEFQGKLSLIKTNKEYQAALKEIAETKRMNKTTEDQILELMNQLETSKKKKDEIGGSLQAIQAAHDKKKQELEVDSERLRGEVKGYEEEKGRLASQIDPVVWNQYQRIRRLRGDAVTMVQGGTCQGCNMHIPPQLFIEIQKLKTVHTCPSCHRILYLPEWASDERPGSEGTEEVRT